MQTTRLLDEYGILIQFDILQENAHPERSM